MTPLNVLLVSPWQTGAGASGVASACRHLAEGLSSHAAAGDIVVLSLSDSRWTDHAGAGRVRVEMLPRQARLALVSNGWPDYLKASRWLRGSGFTPDVVHGQGFAGEGRLAVRLARRLRVPSVVTVHGMVDKEARMYADPARAALARRVMKQTLRAASGIVFVSPYRKDELPTGSATATRVIENAISPELFALESDPSSCTILYAGFVGPRKRLLDLIRALPIVRRSLPRARLRVAGPVSDAAYASAVEREIGRLALEGAVARLGPLDRASLHAEYASAGVLALPSEEENAPQVIAEALASGLPVVATDVGGIAWMVADGVDGFVVPPGDVGALAGRIVAVLSANDRAAMSRGARAQAERFRPERVAGATFDLYRAVGAGGAT
ncbi:MAG: glycosyltransferase family 4 protein [Actinomycetota bacterium]